MFPDRMRANLDVGGGLAYSQNVLLALVDAGMPRDDAYAIVQAAAARAWDEGATSATRSARTRRCAPASIGIGSTSCSTRPGALRNLDVVFDRLEKVAVRGRVSETAARLHGQGKVRDIYDVGDDRLLLVATDRISAFDVVLPDPIPDKGRVLTGLTLFWLDRTKDLDRQPPAQRRPPRLPRAVPRASRRSPAGRCSSRGRR